METPHLEKLFAKDQEVLKSLMEHKECRARFQKYRDDCLWHRINIEDAIWSTWNDGYRSPENRPKHAGSIENEKRIQDFEEDLLKREIRREDLRKEVRQYEVQVIPEIARRFMKEKYGFVFNEKRVRFKDIPIEEKIRERAGGWMLFIALNRGKIVLKYGFKGLR